MEEFRRDARNVKLRISDNFIEDVTDVLKRFFRELEDPIFTLELHPQWKEAAGTSFTQPCSALGFLGPEFPWVGSWCQPWCQLWIGWVHAGSGFPLCRNHLEAAALGAVQGAHPAPASPQPQNPGCAHRAPLPVSGALPSESPAPGRLWGLPAAQGMLAPIPKRQGGPHALLHPCSCCWNVCDTLNIPKAILQQGGVTGSLGLGDTL